MFLTPSQIQELHAAAVRAGLAAQRAGLFSGISPRFAASLPAAATPSEQLLQDLNTLNEVGALVDGSIPLRIWLANAVLLAADRQETLLFQGILLQCTPGPLVERSQGLAAGRTDGGTHPRKPNSVEQINSSGALTNILVVGILIGLVVGLLLARPHLSQIPGTQPAITPFDILFILPIGLFVIPAMSTKRALDSILSQPPAVAPELSARSIRFREFVSDSTIRFGNMALGIAGWWTLLLSFVFFELSVLRLIFTVTAAVPIAFGFRAWLGFIVKWYFASTYSHILRDVSPGATTAQ